MEDVRQLYEGRDRYQIVDVREPFEWEAGHIEGALHIPLGDLLAGREADRLDRSLPVVAVCRVGNRSELARVMLEARGVQAENLAGGMEAWDAAGLPYSTADGAPGRVA